MLLSAILGIVLFGTLYPLVAEALGAKVSVGPPYFNPVSALFFLPMLVVLAVGPLLRWRRDRLDRFAKRLLIPVAVVVIAGIVAWWVGGAGLLPYLGLVFGAGLAVASVLPLRDRNLRRTPLPIWGMVVAHFGVAIALLGAASDSAFSTERLIALRPGESTSVGPWSVRLAGVEPVAGPNWTALEGRLIASYAGAKSVVVRPQARSFWSPPQQTSESALLTRWNGQLYTVLGEQVPDGRWQVRLWWKPFVTLIWLGGILIALGGVLAVIGHVSSDLRRIVARGKIAYRREKQGR